MIVRGEGLGTKVGRARGVSLSVNAVAIFKWTKTVLPTTDGRNLGCVSRLPWWKSYIQIPEGL